MRICDLHTHSNYSDGTLSPAELITEAGRAGLSAVALTDHNTVEGLDEFISAADGSGIEAVPGAEFSVDYLGTELHLVGLFIAPGHYDTLRELFRQSNLRKSESNKLLLSRLSDAGYILDGNVLAEKCKGGSFNRAHVAAELVARGYVDTVKTAFNTLLKPGSGFYTPPKRIDVFETVELIASIGAAPVLAHPLLQLNEEQLRAFLPKAIAHGLRAVETDYSLYSEQDSTLMKRLADEYGLLYSGGSDFHGTNKSDIALGCGKGGLNVPIEYLDALRQ
ncbi:MAG: PHP domain-containing protein [Clostridia bacterium]|nr:PHP domain-containing protein [Clostridia bacterium]